MANYAVNWDNYYRRTYKLLKSKSLWEVNPDIAVEKDRLYFQSYLSANLPIIDIGCGTGEQANCLRKYYPKVIGLDVAQQAIAIAQQRFKETDIIFDTFDITDINSAEVLAANHGSCNIYIRGVLHQTLPEDRALILASIQLLLGKEGSLFLIEIADNIRAYLQEKVATFSELPISMQRALMSNLPPVGLSMEKITEWFDPDIFTIKFSGHAFLATNLLLPDESNLTIPAVHAIITIK
ncbi:MAG: hypothetical protein DA408_20425 [Bacteroidetes bacterium]|nr:MAG: hypothetical protein DA408_20425 [Bacteroidota bacterium]